MPGTAVCSALHAAYLVRLCRSGVEQVGRAALQPGTAVAAHVYQGACVALPDAPLSVQIWTWRSGGARGTQLTLSV